MHPGRLSGIAEKADQTLGLVLRVFENQQADGFLCRAMATVKCAPVRRGQARMRESAIYSDFQSESKSSSPPAVWVFQPVTGVSRSGATCPSERYSNWL